MVKKFLLVFILSFSVLVFIELSSRIFFSIFSKSFYPLIYGFNKNISIYVDDLSNFNFNVQNLNLKKKYDKKKYNNNKKIIWVFGGSTSEYHCDGSSWPDELQILLPNYKVINFATGGASTDINLNKLYQNKNKSMPEIILWANKHNEDFILYFGTTRNDLLFYNSKIHYKKNKLVYFIKSIDLTLRKNSIFYFLFYDLIERVNYKISGPFKSKTKKIYYNEDLEVAARNYEINTEAAIKFAEERNIDFIIVSLFGKFNDQTNYFFKKPIYSFIKEKVNKLKKKWDIKFIDTEKNLILDKEVKYFCDNIHQTYLGNKKTAKIIYEHLKENK